MASIRIFCFSRFRHQSVEVTLIIFVLNDIDRFSVVSNLCKFCTSFFFCQLPILKDVLEVLGHYASVYIKKLCDPILSQPDLAILHTDFNTVVTGILSENEEIDCTVTNGFSVFSCSFPRMMMAGYFTQQPLTSRQHILPRRLEIAGVPRVGYIAGMVGIVHQEVQFSGKIAAADAVHIPQVCAVHAD